MRKSAIGIVVLFWLLGSTLVSASLSIRYPAELNSLNLKLVENQTITYPITIVNNFSRNVLVHITDNNDNKVVDINHPATVFIAEVENFVVDVTIRAKSSGSFWFRVDFNCGFENEENTVKYYGITFKGKVTNEIEEDSVGVSSGSLIWVIIPVFVIFLMGLILRKKKKQ